MKKLLVALCVTCALALTVQAQDKDNKGDKKEHKTGKQEMLDKYDTNKDGKLDKDERAKMSAEDKEKMKAAGGKKKKKES